MYEEEKNKSSFWTWFTIIVGIATVSAAIFAGLTYFNIKPSSSEKKDIVIDNSSFVDLGLSVKWSTCNLGASRPEETGVFYAWGESTTKKNFSKDNYSWYNEYLEPVKYNLRDKKNVIEPKDDPAQKYGARIPKMEEMNELIDQCEWIFTTQEGVNGYKVIGPNGNSIFLPATGYYFEKLLYGDNSNGHYWTSSLYEDNPTKAYLLAFDVEQKPYSISVFERFYGQVIRPVKP